VKALKFKLVSILHNFYCPPGREDDGHLLTEFMLKSGVLTANVLLLAGESKSLVHLARLDTHHVRRRQIRHQLLVRCVRQFKRVRRPSVHLIGHLGSVVQRSTVLIDPDVCCELIGRDGGLTMIAQALHEGARLHFSHLSAL